MTAAGTVYDVGGALAIYWPYVHPCRDSHDQWIILDSDGGIDVVGQLRAGAKALGVIPGMPGGKVS